MRTLFIEPQDVWLFRDGRPFDAGSAHRAESLFPPSPIVLQGAIRSHQLVLKNVDLTNPRQIREAVGESLTFDGALNLNGLTLSGPFLARRKSDGSIERLYPMPADVYQLKSGGFKAASLHSRTLELVCGTSSLLLRPGGDAGKPDESLRWLTEEDLKKYFAGESFEGVRADELYEKENRFGIGRNEQRVVKQSMLYEAEFVRLRAGVGLLVDMDGYNDAGWEAGLMQLGGESRAARYETVASVPMLSQPSTPPPCFKIYFVTSAYFSDGVEPKPKPEMNSSDPNLKTKLWENFFGGEVALGTVAVRGYETLGGFHWAKNPNSHEAHRPSRRYVPAGSVYYFKNISGTKIPESLTEFGAEIGFGRFILSETKEW
jgi:CRISPR-associated protein Cmr3